MRGTRWWVGLVVVTGLVQAGLAARTARPGGILEHRYALLAEIAVWAAVSALTVVGLLRLPRRLAVGLLLGLALVVRLASLSEKAPLSDDLYRYAWDGVVQETGTSPYRHPPLAPELAPLRDDPRLTGWVWPDGSASDETWINRAGVRTIYPPVAEAFFWVEAQVLPLSLRDRAYEGAGLVVDLAVLAALVRLLRTRGDPRWAAVYGLTPLPVLESVQNAHVDVLGVLLVLGAVALLPRGDPGRGRLGAASAVLTLAVLVKLWPAVLLPVLVRRQPPGRVVLAAAVSVAVVVLAYLPHVLAVGTDVLGYLPGYLEEEQYDGERFLLLPGGPLVAAVAGAAMLLAALRSRRSFAATGVRLLAGLLLVVTPVQPWYAVLLVALVALSGWWPGLAVAAAGYPLFFATILDGPADLVGRLSYGAAAVVVVVALLAERRSRGGTADRGADGGAAVSAAAAAPPPRRPGGP